MSDNTTTRKRAARTLMGWTPGLTYAQALARIDAGLALIATGSLAPNSDAAAAVTAAATVLNAAPASTAPATGQAASKADDLVSLASRFSLDPIDLDDLVHDLFASQASDVNNSGLDGQIEYLVDALGPEEAETEIRRLTDDADCIDDCADHDPDCDGYCDHLTGHRNACLALRPAAAFPVHAEKVHLT